MRRAVWNDSPLRSLLAGFWLAIAIAGCATSRVKPEGALPPERTTELWSASPATEQRDLYWGAGGAENAPQPNAEYQFLSEKEDLISYSSGYDVRDAAGREWSVKLGDEVRPEVLAARITWAAGYRQPPVYMVPAWTMVRDGERKAMPPARFRLATKEWKKEGEWSWEDNPFVGSRPFHGLVVLMAIIGNWDVEDHNTAIYAPGPRWGDAQRWYVVKDVGASFSRGGGAWPFSGTRNDVPGYVEGKLIERTDGDRVELAWNGRQPALFASLPAADVRWLGERLDRISEPQWEEAFRAAGYDASESAPIRAELGRRIGEALALSVAAPRSLDHGGLVQQNAGVDDRPGS